MFGIGGTELFLILLFAFLIVGPDKLPQIGRTVGRAMRQFRNAQDEVNRVIRTEVYDPIMDNEPLKKPSDIVAGNKGTAKRAVQTVSPESTETFAERRARLAKEKAAREEAAAKAAAAQDAAAEGGLGDVAGAAGAGTAEAGAVGATDAADATAAEQPVRTTETFAERRARLERQRTELAAAAATSSTTEDARGEGA